MGKFKKGQSGNPSGRPKMPRELLEAKRLTQAKFIELTNKYLHKTKEEIAASAKDPATPALEIMIASIIGRAITQGDHQRLNFILDRMVGKVADKVEQHVVNHDSVESLLEEWDRLDASENSGQAKKPTA